ncbi:glycosyltransferase family 2 protein [Cognatilysobacter segetis]|uniref:glycosyltransferase family 2 protein n=1 Tax=Cognatilysobacter segetis TaxID=2492394 RepID=UPI00105C7628|nr:glycosyltransferase family 2 protein [Lysobacter segetis]
MTATDPTRATPWLSLLLPVYNVEAYVGACVESIAAQSMDGIEILLLDDCSTDGSRRVLDDLARRHPQVRVLAHERNGGLSAARNTLLRHARGEYVWFVDSDDLLLPGALSSLGRVVEQSAPDLVLCDYRVHREHMALKHRLRGELHRRTFDGPARRCLDDRSQLATGLLRQGQLHSWTKIARREVWQAAPFPEHRYFEDIAVVAPLLAATRSAYYVPETWIAYRQREGSIMKCLDARKNADLVQSLTELHAGLASRLALSPDASFALEHFCIKTCASLARRLGRGDIAAQAALHEAMTARIGELFPSGVAGVLAEYRRRGWWLRARRARRSLSRVGWLQS